MGSYLFVPLTEFQFLMVRLKDTLNLQKPGQRLISIPYGSIKSQLHTRGKINRVKFQFLMVRLKDYSVFAKYQIFKFQFLMVRLKEEAIEKDASGVRTGISIPYGSIKRLLLHQLIPLFRISIPYGSIKRFFAASVTFAKMYFNSLWFD